MHYRHSEESRKKISENNKGKRHGGGWNKGKHHTEAAKQKIREWALGRSITQHRVKDRPKGRPLTDEENLKINDFLAGL